MEKNKVTVSENNRFRQVESYRFPKVAVYCPGNRTSAQELRYKFLKISFTSAHVILLHYAELKIPILSQSYRFCEKVTVVMKVTVFQQKITVFE